MKMKMKTKRESVVAIKASALMSRDMPIGFEEEFAKARELNDATCLWKWVENYLYNSDKEASNKIAKGYYGNSHNYIRRGKGPDIKPEVIPDVRIEIKKMIKPDRRTKSGKKEEYGVEISVNDNDIPIPVFFGSQVARFIYICALLRIKAGENLFLHEFFNNGNGFRQNSRFKKNKSAGWFRDVYEKIISGEKGFGTWLKKINIDELHGRPINLGKDQVNRDISNALVNDRSAIYVCKLNTKKDDLGDSYYKIRIPKDNIIIPKEFEPIVSGVKDIIVGPKPSQT